MRSIVYQIDTYIVKHLKRELGGKNIDFRNLSSNFNAYENGALSLESIRSGTFFSFFFYLTLDFSCPPWA